MSNIATNQLRPGSANQTLITSGATPVWVDLTNSIVSQTVVRSIPTNGNSITIAATTDRQIIDPASTIATLTIVMPTSPIAGKDYFIVCGNFGVTTLTLNPVGPASATFVSGAIITSLTMGQSVSYQYNATSNNWYKTSDAGISAGDMLKSTYDTTNNGIVDNSEALGGQNSAYHLARGNHSGTQAASTISDFNSVSRAQTEAELIAGTGINITPASSGATRTLTITSTSSGATNLSIANNTSTTIDVVSDTGTDATIPSATTSLAGLQSAADKTKLNIASSVELGYLSGVTSAIQTQFSNKQPLDTGLTALAALTGTGYIKETATDTFSVVSSIPAVDITAMTISRAVISDASGFISPSSTTATEIGYVSGVTSAIQTQLNNKQATITGGATTISSSDLTINRALVSNASGKVTVSTTTDTELGYLSGVTSAIQTQLNSKQASDAGLTSISSLTGAGYVKATGTDTFTMQSSISATDITAMTISRAVVSDGSGFISPSSTTSTELGYVSGVTSAIQTQINNISNSAGPADEFLVDIHAQANTTLSGAQTVDGYTTTSGELVNCTSQTTTSQNGPWFTSAGAWTRPTWWASGSVKKSSVSFKASGIGANWASQRGQIVTITNTTNITVDTTGVTFTIPMTMEANGLSLGRWWAASNPVLSLYSAGSTTATATITRASSANGNFTIASTGTGIFSLSNNATTILTVTSNTSMIVGCALAAATLQLGSTTQTTGNITVGPALSSGTITLGNAAGTGVHVITSTPVAASPSLQINANQAATATVLALGNVNAGTASGKSVDLLFGADATPFTGARIRAISTNAFAWNSASQQASLRFAVGYGTALQESLVIKSSSTTAGTGPFVGIGSTVTPQAKLQLSGDPISYTSWATTGISLSIIASTFTDTSTAISGTVAHHAINAIAQPTIAATNTGVVNANASTFYIAGPPTAGTNVTITNPWSMYAATGNAFVGGTIQSGGLTINKAVVTDGSKNLISSSTSAAEIAFVSGVTGAIQTQLDSKQPLDATLTALANTIGSSNGYVKVTGTDTFLVLTNVPNYEIQNSTLYLAPTIAGNTTMNTATNNVIIEPASQLSSYTINMPSTGGAILDNSIYTISCAAFGITSLILNPVGPASATFATGHAITSIVPGESVTYQYRNSSNKWYKIVHVKTNGITYYTPTTGSTISLLATSESNIIEPTSTIATLTINMPTTPVDSQIFTMTAGNFGVTALTINPVGPTSATFATSAIITTLPAGASVAYQYRQPTNRWYRYFNSSSANGTVTSIDVSGGTTGLTATGGPITTSGTITLGGTLAVANGGTNISSYTIGDILYASASGVVSKLADVATGNALISGGVGVAPSYGKVGLTTHISGTLPIANGGTNLTTYTTGDLVYASATNTLASLADVATGNVLRSGGIGVAPSYGKIVLGTDVTALTVSRAAVTDASGFITAATTTATEIGFVNGVTSSIQTQLNAKQASDAGLTSLAALTGAGYVKATGTDTFTMVATPIPATDGGTGQSTYAVGDLLIGGASNTLTKLSDVAVGNVLRSGGVGVAPAYGKLNITTDTVVPTNYQSPTTGATINLAVADQTVIIEPTALIATLTINMPTTPADGQIVNISCGNFGVTSLTLNPVGPASATFATNAVITKLMAGDAVAYQYRTSTNRWYRYANSSAYIDQKTTTGIYTLLSSDSGRTVYVDNTVTVPSLPANTQIEIFNEAASPITITFSGVTAKGNASLTTLNAESYAVFTWKDATNVRCYGGFA